MKMTFRWYGESDPVSVRYISQIPTVTGVVSAVYDVPPGEVWSVESIKRVRSAAEKAGLEFEVVESVPVHEDIKLGKPTRDKYIEVYKENIRRLGKAGIKCICYNFMPVFDWLRSRLDFENPDGSTSLVYRESDLQNMDPRSGELSLPGWDSSYTKESLNMLLDEYKDIDEDKLWENLKYFLDAIIPVCEEYSVNMAIHPDDPPYPLLGLPRVLSTADDFRKIIESVPNKSNGLCLCTGSFGVRADNDCVSMMSEFGDRVGFVHLRTTKRDAAGNFYEANLLEGDVDMYGMMKALLEVEQRRGVSIPVRPDHGHQMCDDLGRKSNPGYSCYGRMRSLAELRGLQEGIIRSMK